MLLANKTVAKDLTQIRKKSLDFIYRFHDLPYKDKIINLKCFVQNLGYNLDITNQKTLSEEQIINVCNHIAIPVVVIGGGQEHKKGASIVMKCTNSKIYNFCGDLSLDQSAYLTKNSSLVLTNDTGLMHIASAFHKPIISFWGCTKPILGFTPYMNKSICIKVILLK